MKALGSEIQAFLTERFAQDIDSYWDEYDSSFEGPDHLKPKKRYDLTRAGVFVNGNLTRVSFQEEFRVWARARTHTTYLVQVPKVEIDQFKAYCAQHGWLFAT